MDVELGKVSLTCADWYPFRMKSIISTGNSF